MLSISPSLRNLITQPHMSSSTIIEYFLKKVGTYDQMLELSWVPSTLNLSQHQLYYKDGLKF